MDELERIIEALIDLLIADYRREHRSQLVWEALVLDGNYKLIETLRLVELGHLKTVILPDTGFSTNHRVHLLVIDWCRDHDVCLLNVSATIRYLEAACTWRWNHFLTQV
jgi:hypothetical protein